MAKLFEYAVIHHAPAKKKGDDAPATKDTLLVDLTTVLAASDREVSIIAARQIPESHTDKLDEIEIVIRPF